MTATEQPMARRPTFAPGDYIYLRRTRTEATEIIVELPGQTLTDEIFALQPPIGDFTWGIDARLCAVRPDDTDGARLICTLITTSTSGIRFWLEDPFGD